MEYVDKPKTYAECEWSYVHFSDPDVIRKCAKEIPPFGEFLDPRDFDPYIKYALMNALVAFRSRNLYNVFLHLHVAAQVQVQLEQWERDREFEVSRQDFDFEEESA